MSTLLAGTAATVRRGGGDRASRAARRLFSDLMAVEPSIRREFIRGLPAKDMAQVFAAAKREGGTPYAIYVDDALGFVEDILGENVWSKSREILESLTTHNLIAVPSCFSSSKCIPYSEAIQLADGSVVSAAELIERGTFHVLGWQEDGTQTVRRARAKWNQIEPVYRLTSASGRTISRSGHHPLWVAGAHRDSRPKRKDGTITTALTPQPRGWVHMRDIDAANDLVLVPDIVHTVGDGQMPTEEAALLGYLLGDGGTTTNVSFTQLPGPAMDDFLACVDKLGCLITEHSKPGSKARVVEVVGTKGWVGGRKTNRLRELCREWGILGCKATEKRIPAEVWRMNAQTIATVAGRLFSCDGFVHIRTEKTLRGERVPLNEAYVAITLVNEGLIRDFQRMMLRLGVSGTVRPVGGMWNGKPVDSWQWVVTTAAEIQRFAEVIDAPAKNEQIARAVEVASGRKYRKDWRFKEAPPGYHWEKIQGIVQEPDAMTVSVEVEEDHTWVDHFVEHNSWTLSRSALWFSCVHPVGTARVVTLAPQWRQVSGIMWGSEIRGSHARAKLPGVVGDVQLKVPNAEGVMLRVAEGIVGNPRNEASTQGLHAPHVLVLVDEAGGIPWGVGNNLRALLTAEGTQMVAIGNPPSDDEGTWFEDLCSRDDVRTIPISALSTPNLTGEKVLRCRSCPSEAPAHTIAKHLVKREFVEEVRREFGEDSPYYQAKVLARFPKGGARRVIPSLWADAATDRPEPGVSHEWVRLTDLGLQDEASGWIVERGAWIRLGVDVAADGGDEFVVSRSVGDLGTIEHISSGPINENAPDVAGVVLEHIRRAQALRHVLGTEAPIRVKIDSIGVGWGVVGILQGWGSEGLHDAEIVPVNVAEATGREPQGGAAMVPYRKRDEMWLAMRGLLQPPPEEEYGSLRLRVDRKTVAQLVTPGYGTTSTGFIRVESKALVKKRIPNSPDRAEALLLAFYEPLDTKRTGRPRLLC